MTRHTKDNQTATFLKGVRLNRIQRAHFSSKFLVFLLGFAIVFAGLEYWGLGNWLAHSQAAGETAVFGAKTYTRTKGKPTAVLDAFNVPNAAKDYTLVVQNGNNGPQRVSSAVISINGQLIVGPWHFSKQIDVIRQQVALQAENTISVEVRGQPGTFLKVSIVGTGLNTIPIADAGDDQTVKIGDQVALDGSDSSDADRDPLSFRWRFVKIPENSLATLSDISAVRPQFTVDLPGSYTLELIVNDGHEDSAPDTVTISTFSSPPIAKAGPDQSVPLGAIVTLDGSGSMDVDGDLLAYRWTLDTVPAGSQATLANATTDSPSFTVDKPGIYLIVLVVNDGTVDSDPDYVVVTTLNSKPVADAGPDQQAVLGNSVSLNGSNSYDADNDPLTYTWSLAAKPQGSTVTLINPDQFDTTLVPDRAGDYAAQLIVHDGQIASEPDTAIITVADAKHPPIITSIPVSVAQAGQLYSYNVDASDPDAGDVLSYSLTIKPVEMTIDTGSGLIQWAPSQAGAVNVAVRVTDLAGLYDEQEFTITVEVPPPINEPPQVIAVADPQMITLPINSVALNGTIADDGLPIPPGAVTTIWTKDSGPGTVSFANANVGDTTANFSSAGTYVLRLTAKDGEKNAFATVTIIVNPEEPLPPAPETVAPPIDPTIATTTYAATEFLYTGSNPIQTGVAPGTIEPRRSAVLRGKVLNRDNQPLPGVIITVLNHPEFGQTLSRADGMFDLAVNGGGDLTVNYQHSGYLPAQRQISTRWQDYVVVEDVVLVARDGQATLVDLNNATEYQVARGNVVTDEVGSRQATLLIPPGTQAQVYNPDGSTRPLTSLTLRATEYTVGDNGPQTMPAKLPPTSAYTYAVELSADEAITKLNGKDVLFNQPVPFYVENFLNFPVGGEVPVGHYDNTKAAWIPHDNGRIIQIVGIKDGRAEIDANGSGNPADAALLVALGIGDSEREILATLYAPGKSLWRITLSHLSTWDLNWPYGPPADAQGPAVNGPEDPDGEKPKEPCPPVEGSLIDCENQTLGERIPIVGTSLSLNYRSDRVPGRKSQSNLLIPLSGETVPASVKRIDLEISIAGRTLTQSFSPAGGQFTTFTWDGKDAYGRILKGAQAATVRIGYVYDGVYQEPQSGRGFGLPSGVAITCPGGCHNDTLQENKLSQTFKVTLNPPDFREVGVGGWTLNVHHAYDPIGRILYLGTGERRSADDLGLVISTLAGTAGVGYSGDGGLASQANFHSPFGIVVAPDGSYYIADGNNYRIRRVGTDGIIQTIAGNGTYGFSGDGGPATEAQISNPSDIALGSDGALYIADTMNQRVRRVGPDGIITTVAGGGQPADGLGDGGPATEAKLGNTHGVRVGPDGTIYIADPGHARVRRVGTDGIITTVAGNGKPGFSGDGGPATQAQISTSFTGVGLDSAGSLYIADGGNSRIRRVGSDGIITTVAGNGTYGYSGDGVLAIQTQLATGSGIVSEPDGSLYITDTFNHRIRRIGPDGIITTIGGNGELGFNGDGSPATQARLGDSYNLAFGADGSLLVADAGNNCIRVLKQAMPGFDNGQIVLVSENGGEVYIFDRMGRHLRTINSLTGATLYEFSYNTRGNLIKVIDGDGNVTTIERDGSGNPIAIVSPFGQLTALILEGNSYLGSVTNPAGESFTMKYTTEGLLTGFIDPNGNISEFTYDLLGRIVLDRNAAGGTQAVSRTNIAFSSNTAVTHTTALGRATTYWTERFSSGDQQRRISFPDGTESQRLLGTNGSTKVTRTDGTVIDLLKGPDPRFGMEAPIAQSLTTIMGGLTSTVTKQRSVNLAIVGNPLSLTSLTDWVSINGRHRYSDFNAFTRTWIEISAAGRQSMAIIDAQGRVTQTQIGGLFAVDKSYDSRGRLTGITQGSGDDARTTVFTYNSNGYLETTTDAVGRSTSFEYDAAGRVTRQTLPDGGIIQYGYDANGNQTSLTPPGQSAHIFGYTPVNLVAQYMPPDVGIGNTSTRYTYNAEKQLTQTIRPDGKLLSYDYDSAGRLSTLTQPDGQLGYSYDATTGKLVSITSSDGALTYSYNGELLTRTSWIGTISGEVSQSYDNDFRVIAQSLNGANPVTYQYDDDSLLIGAGELTLYRDSQNGLLAGSSLANISDQLTYNDFGEVMDYSVQYLGSTVFSCQYTRDKLGRLTQKVEAIGGATTILDYGYDLAGRLIEVRQNGTVISSYTYDPNGNRLSRSAGVSTITGIYDGQDRLLSYGTATYTFTPNGELLTKTDGGQTTTYSYDVLGNLKRVSLPGGTLIEYVIDGQNRRIGKKINGTLFQGLLYKDELNLIAELDGSGQVLSRFIYGGGVNVPDYMIKGGVTYRIIVDHLGSPRLVIDVATGNIAQRIDYDEFGNVLHDNNPGFQPFGFAGGLYDLDTRLVRFGARDYDPQIGRWTAKDPILFFGGDRNLYSYCSNNPINFSDPLGKSIIDDNDILDPSGKETGYSAGENDVPSVRPYDPIPPNEPKTKPPLVKRPPKPTLPPGTPNNWKELPPLEVPSIEELPSEYPTWAACSF